MFRLASAAWRTACSSLYGTRTNPGTSGSKPACALRLPVADSVASVRPCQACSITMIAALWTLFWWPYRRASLIAVSFASEPELQKNTSSMPASAQIRSASAVWCRDLVEVRGVDDLRRLVRDGPHEARVAVPEAGHGDARQRIEILLAGLVPQPGAFAAHERHREACVGRHDVGGHGGESRMENGGLRRRNVLKMLAQGPGA